ncbi:hypothetical protein FA15DRAFT_594332 [Coprinopsis marcescibilis]|uniref:Ubiquinol-cytochrome c chaperone domain-containing protein n=1 Tax=Coprinopsis marcescibilis TaxID=230819 RepID=A0A5C3KSW6_COPMA|nr:hypothetical protein FA15DRAFT_594332 [Coprinopsis marcescibilis]
MVARSLLLRQLASCRRPLPVVAYSPRRLNSSGSTSQPPPSPAKVPAPHEKSWLTRQVETSPRAKRAVLALAKAMGYGSAKQLGGRRSFVLYEKVCAVKPDEDAAYWQKECYLPPTFQSWFTITNLHLWMLTVRLRALPEEHGKHYIQALLDHFFLDIEDRIRDVLQPKLEPSPPYTFRSDFYVNPNAATPGKHLTARALARAPDKIVTQQMKIFKEQWAGLGMAFDLGMVQGDMEMAAAIWRNVLGARGAQGIEYPDPTATEPSTPKFRRSVNLVGGEVVNVSKVDFSKEEATDDGSGVHDFSPSEVDKYLSYPDVMLDLTVYIRRELARLDKLSDREVMYGDWSQLKFGPIKSKSS